MEVRRGQNARCVEPHDRRKCEMVAVRKGAAKPRGPVKGKLPPVAVTAPKNEAATPKGGLG